MISVETKKEIHVLLFRLHLVISLLFISLSVVADTVRYQHTDALGSVIAESDANGTIITRSHYQPFGKRIEGNKEGIGYTGHMHDSSLGLTYMQARYYDPVIGRFYSNDPIGFRDVHSFNRYAYANNNPYKYIDPDGRNGVTAFGGLLYESGQFLQGNGFNGSRVLGALKDGYDGNGSGALAAAGEDALAFGGGIIGGVAKLYRMGKASTGVLESANYAQKTFGANFSATGKFAGQTVDDVAGALSSGKLKVGDVPIDFIKRGDSTLILNTRSSQALTKAGIPRSQWKAVDRTGQKKFEAMLDGQLKRNKLSESGISTVRQSGTQ